jgi:tRNA G37 N-methylase Trm5
VRAIVQAALLWYARNLPYHRGKQRFSQWLRGRFHVSLEGEYVERRTDLWWALDPGDYIQQDVFWASAKDSADIRAALRSMPRGGVMFDLGANFGYYAITIAVRLKGDCRIYAFEPNPPTMRRFRKNLELNTSGDNTTGIPVTTLDSFCERQKIERLDLVKMDIERAGLRALLGGIRTLKRFRPVILMELNPHTLGREGVSVREVVILLEDLISVVKPRFPITRDRLPPPTEIVNALCRPI